MAYAAVISLKHTIEHLIHPINPQISKSAYEELQLLQDVLERLDRSTNRDADRDTLKSLDSQIRDAVWRLEDVLQSHLLHHHSLIPSDDVAAAAADEAVIQEIFSFLKTAKELKEEYTRELDMPFAAVISLRHSIKDLIDPINPQISGSAHGELKLLEDALKRLDGSTNRSIDRSTIKEFDAEIREAVCKLEDVLHHSLPPSDDLTADEAVNQEIGTLLKTVRKWKDVFTRKLDNPSPVEEDEADLSEGDFPGKKSTMVGLWKKYEEISDELLDSQPKRKIVSLVGMAGIGKTFLAREIYEGVNSVRRSNVPHFKLRAWAGVGPTRKIESVLVDLLSQIEPNMPVNSYLEQDKQTLGDLLHKSLFRRKYMIVLDDIWNTDEMVSLMNYIPDHRNGSRIMVTTRLERLPCPQGTDFIPHNLGLLRIEESWRLLSQSVFGEESFPPELEKAGRKIAENCEGLPLLIVAVASILCQEKQDEYYWNEVAEKRNTNTFTDAYEKIEKVVSSSFEYLPQHLKACFLYMGVFPQNSEIPVSKLINLWSVEDFLEPSQSQSLQDFAVKCLDELVSKSLVMVHKHSASYRVKPDKLSKLDSDHVIKSCKLHSTYWSMCVKEARKSRFLQVLQKLSYHTEDQIESQQEEANSDPISCRRLSIQNNILFGIEDVQESLAAASTTRSLLCSGESNQYPVPVSFDLMFLEVLDALSMRFYDFPEEVLKLLQLKYLALTHNGSLPSFISKLQNLQSLILGQHHSIKFVQKPTSLPQEIWDLRELRHLRIMGRDLPDPTNGGELPNLLTLHVEGHSCTEDVFRRTPKLKKLGIKIKLQPRSSEVLSCFEHISILEELESLKCVVVNPKPWSQLVSPPNPTSSFPTSLKRLSLNGTGYPWKCMSLIGSIPKLEVLKLRCCAFRGEEWEIQDGEFPALKFLLLEDIDLVRWTTEEEKCFESLQYLFIRHCYNLEDIPWENIVEIETLKMIEIVDCHPLVMDLAQHILKEKRSNANDSFQVPITTSLNLPLQADESVY